MTPTTPAPATEAPVSFTMDTPDGELTVEIRSQGTPDPADTMNSDASPALDALGSN